MDIGKKHDKKQGWIAVDLDGTLAHYDGWKGVDHIGEPIPAMVARVLRWLTAGRVVVIFTARITSETEEVSEVAKHYIEEWCQEHIGTKLPVTNIKHSEFSEFWDDRAIGVEKNTGAVLSGHSRLDEELQVVGRKRVSYSTCEHEIPLGNFCPRCANL